MFMNFELHPQLEKDLILLGDLGLSKMMLMPDSDNPWIILVPRVDKITEYFQLSESEQNKLNHEMNSVSSFMHYAFEADKINIGMLGNMVPQLHIHIICRYRDDKAWPGSIWGVKSELDEIRLKQIADTIIDKFNF